MVATRFRCESQATTHNLAIRLRRLADPFTPSCRLAVLRRLADPFTPFGRFARLLTAIARGLPGTP
eukprot:229311-Heterocapsa_arctica.AAC.1